MYYCHLILILQLYFDYRCISNTKVINGLILTLDICIYITFLKSIHHYYQIIT